MNGRSVCSLNLYASVCQRKFLIMDREYSGVNEYDRNKVQKRWEIFWFPKSQHKFWHSSITWLDFTPEMYLAEPILFPAAIVWSVVLQGYWESSWGEGAKATPTHEPSVQAMPLGDQFPNNIYIVFRVIRHEATCQSLFAFHEMKHIKTPFLAAIWFNWLTSWRVRG